MKNGVCPDSIGAGSVRAPFFLARKKVRGMVERCFSRLLVLLCQMSRRVSPRPQPELALPSP